MEDVKIIELYWMRSEEAIRETQNKYGRYCHTVAYNILYSNEDADECVNDTYMKVWKTVPPHRPERFAAFLGKITRNLALDRYDKLRSQKRGGNTELALDELKDCVAVSGYDIPVSDEMVLKEAINAFLRSLPKRTRIIFLRRYFYLCSISDIARSLEMSESNVKVTLSRTRAKFKAYLEKEGINV